MPRIRTIKPEFASDRKLAGVSRGARLTFILLITQADDDGLVLGSPRQLLGQLYPHDDAVDLATLSRELRELVGIGLVRHRETVDGAAVVELVNWSKHQRIDHRGKSLILPTLRPPSAEPREFLATPSRDSRAPTLDLGPRTVDLGPPSNYGDRTEVDRTVSEPASTAPPAGPTARTAETFNAFVAQAGDLWGTLVGTPDYGRIAADLKAPYRLHGPQACLAAIQRFAEHRTRAVKAGAEKPDSWPQFVRDLVDYIPRSMRPAPQQGAA